VYAECSSLDKSNSYSVIMSRRLNRLISHVSPGLGKFKRILLAYLAKLLPIRKSYAQLGDDEIAISFLCSIGKAKKLFYVDIGANHPTRLSNTYRMYREGARGLIIEPNIELIQLHKRIRPFDVQLAVGTGSSDKISKFYISKTPVLSSFQKNQVDDLWSTEYLPVFMLDTICLNLNITSIDFLSIDVEGLDLDVLKGAINALKFTRLVCVEANNAQEEASISLFMSANGFELHNKNQWNLFYVHSKSL